jgi:drug/metabolite transporter (DMT)-like permease
VLKIQKVTLNMSGSLRYVAFSLLSALLYGACFPVIVPSISSFGVGGALTSIYGVAAFVTLVFVLRGHRRHSMLYGVFSVEFLTRAVLFIGQIIPLYVAFELVDRAFIGGVFLCFFLWPVLAMFYVRCLTPVKVARELSLFVGAIFLVVALGAEFLEQGLMGLAGSDTVVAYCLALIAANSCALYAAVVRRFGYKGGGDAMIPVLCLLVACCGVVMTIANPERDDSFLAWPLVVVGVATGCAHLLWDTSVRRGNGLVACAIACFTPWIAILFTSLLLGVELVEHIEERVLLLTLAAVSIAYGVLSARADR